jgi:hypothetical protein
MDKACQRGEPDAVPADEDAAMTPLLARSSPAESRTAVAFDFPQATLFSLPAGGSVIGRSPVVAPMRRVFESVSRLIDHLTIGSLLAIRDLDPRFMAQEELEELICLAEVLKPSA